MWVLSLLDGGPKTGAELMDAMEEMSQGWWRPSPGSLYPLLNDLVKEGVLQSDENKRYSLTEKGRSDYYGWPPWMGRHGRKGSEDQFAEIEGYVSYLEDLSKTDRKRFESYSAQIVRLRDRLSSLVQQGGEKE